MRFAYLLGLIVVAMAASPPPSGDSPQSQEQQSRFRAAVELVALNVTVTDGAKRYLSDLDQADFQIVEDGRKQEVAFFQKAALPLALVLLMDTSASMRDDLLVAQDAAIGFARTLGAADVASVIDFDSSVRVLQDFTNNRAAIERAIRATQANGSTALYNAMYIALRQLAKTPAGPRSVEQRRQAIVLLSDGDDTASLVGFDEVLDLAARSDTSIYSIGLGLRSQQPGLQARQSGRGPEAQFVLRRLAEQTGGRTYFPQLASDLAAVYAEIKAELSSQYSLAYESTNTARDGRFRRVSVLIARPGGVGRTRSGYYAPAR